MTIRARSLSKKILEEKASRLKQNGNYQPSPINKQMVYDYEKNPVEFQRPKNN